MLLHNNKNILNITEPIICLKMVMVVNFMRRVFSYSYFLKGCAIVECIIFNVQYIITHYVITYSKIFDVNILIILGLKEMAAFWREKKMS